MFRHVVRPLLAMAIALAPAWADAALYRWVDELGVTHYTTDLDTIPSSARDNALEIVASPAPVAATRALPVPPAPPEAVSEPPPAAAAIPPVLEPAPAPVDAAPPAPVALESPPLTPALPEPSAAPAIEPATAVEPPISTEPPLASEPPAPTEHATATEPAPATEWPASTPSSQPVFPGPSATPEIPADDPRAAEVAELEAQIAADREKLRQMISTKRWDSAELASDPNIREIAERLPRLQAELAALRAETVP